VLSEFIAALPTGDNIVSSAQIELRIARFLVLLSIYRSNSAVVRRITCSTAVDFLIEFSVHVRVNCSILLLPPSAIYDR
jgi:hypothetical protein